MKNNFKDWDKETLKIVSARGGRSKSWKKKHAAKRRWQARYYNHILGNKYDNMVAISEHNRKK